MKRFIYLLAVLLLVASSCKERVSGPELNVPFEKFTMANGLNVILHQDNSDPIVTVALYYHVGSSREDVGKTGFAHLFEHMMFQQSENIRQDQFFRNILNVGGTLNGSTNQDRTNYYEVVPKNALEMVLWMESDRMGYLTNTVTQSTLVNQQNVVQNEKRQSVDNAPYGFNYETILKNLYPEGHPYSWTVIGSMEDLTNASVDDVRAFHKKWYSPNNATLALSGDINFEEAKALVEKYFGEIPASDPIEKRKPQNITLTETKKFYHEDNFANTAQFTMVFPTVERYSKDSYALSFLGELLAGGKKSPLYNVLVKEKKLTSRVSARNQSQELAGSMTISVNANPSVSLADVEAAIFEGFERFEKEGINENDLIKIKAGIETDFYNSFSSVQGKAFRLAEYNIFAGDPAFYKKDFQNSLDVTSADILNAYNKYIKGKNYLATSFVPKGQSSLIALNSNPAGIVEEDIANAAEVKAEETTEEVFARTETVLDRSVMPAIGPDPEVNIPEVWTGELANGIKIWGITQNELPLIQYDLVIDGGHLQDNIDKAGVANLVAILLNEGTKNKTPEELEDAIDLLGARISIYAGTENITVSVSTLARNFDATLALVEEMLLEPRWDEEAFGLSKSRIINGLKREKSSPTAIASSTFNKLLYGSDNILSTDVSGTMESVGSITIDDLKAFYEANFSPTVSKVLIAGSIDLDKAVASLSSLGEKWSPKEVTLNSVPAPKKIEKPVLYFVDVPGAKQSVITIGCPAVPRSSEDFFPLYVVNHKLGGASLNGIFNLILREEKGFTYGASSSVSGGENYGSVQGLLTGKDHSYPGVGTDLQE